MREAAAERRQEAQAARAAAAQVHDAHSLKNTFVLVWVALMLALAVGVCAAVLGAFVHSLLAIPGSIMPISDTGASWPRCALLWRGLPACSGSPASHRESPPGGLADPPGGGPLEPTPVTPGDRGSFLDRLARWPVVSWFIGCRQGARGGSVRVRPASQ
jgi:hypothetical protein